MKFKKCLGALAILLALTTVACNGGGNSSAAPNNGSKSNSQQSTSVLPSINVTAADNKKTLEVDETVKLTASVEGVTWESSAPAVATVDGEGLVTAVAAGTAKIDMRLSAEYKSPSFSISSTGGDNASKYTVKVNGTAIDYGKITFTDVPAQGTGWKPFADYPLTASVPLVEGKNTVEMITDNKDLFFGTAESTAPMIDCITVETSCTLSWLNAKGSQLLQAVIAHEEIFRNTKEIS